MLDMDHDAVVRCVGAIDPDRRDALDECSAGRLRRPVRLLVDRFRVVLGTLDVGVLVDAAGDVRIVGVECVVPTGSPVSGVVSGCSSLWGVSGSLIGGCAGQSGVWV